MTSAADELHAFGNAVMFFTRIRLPKRLRWSEELMQKAAGWYPAVGLIVGLIAAGVAWMTLRVFDPAVAAATSTIVTLLVTGAFHEDGLADSCDALFGASEPTRVLEIMKDSRIGSFGAAGLIMVLLTKVLLLTSILSTGVNGSAAGTGGWQRQGNTVMALVVAHTVSRAASVSVLRMLTYVRANDLIGAKSKPMATRISLPRLSFALVTAALVVAVLVSPRRIPMLVGLTALSTVALAVWFKRRIGGYTGDCLGAVQQITEIVVLGVLAAKVISWN